MPSSNSASEQTAWLEIFLLWFAGISAAMQFAKFSVSYNELLTYYQAGPTLTGAAISVVGTIGLIFGVTAGLIAGKIGYRKVLIGALILGALLSFVQSLLPTFEIVMATRVLEGFSQLGVVVAAPTMIAKLSAARHRSITMGLWGTFFGVAFALTGLFGKSLISHFELSGLYFTHGLLMGGMAIALIALLDKNEQRYHSGSVASNEPYFKKLGKIYRTPQTLLPGLVFVFYTCTLVSLLTYIPNFIESDSLRATMQVILPLLSTAGTFIAGTLSQYAMRPQRVAQVAYAGLACGALVLFSNLSSPMAFCLVVGQMVLFAGLIPGAALAMIPRLARNSDEQANGYGLIAQLGNLGATVGPPSFATLITAYGLNGLVGLVWFICAMGSVFAFMAARIER